LDGRGLHAVHRTILVNRTSFVDVAQLIDDFFDEVERYMAQRGLGTPVVNVEEKRRPK